jgi:hypothetical protein
MPEVYLSLHVPQPPLTRHSPPPIVELPQSVGPEWSWHALSHQHLVALSQRVKLLKLDKHLSPPSVLEVNNAGIYTFIYRHFFMSWCLSSGANFTCIFTFAFPRPPLKANILWCRKTVHRRHSLQHSAFPAPCDHISRLTSRFSTAVLQNGIQPSSIKLQTQTKDCKTNYSKAEAEVYKTFMSFLVLNRNSCVKLSRNILRLRQEIQQVLSVGSVEFDSEVVSTCSEMKQLGHLLESRIFILGVVLKQNKIVVSHDKYPECL